MKSITIFILLSSLFANAEEAKWFAYEHFGETVEYCDKSMEPGYQMSQFDALKVEYKLSNEVRDKKGKVISVAIDQGSEEKPSYKAYFRDLKACKKDQQKAKAALDKKVEADPKVQEHKKKYGDYE